MTNQIKNDTSRSEEGKCLWTANEGSEVLPPRCLLLSEKTLSCEGNQFFSDRSLGVLIFFFSPLKQLSWETAVLEIHKEAVFSHFPSLLFLQLGWLTTLIRTTPKNASLRSHLSSVSLPIPSSAAAIPSHGTSVFALVWSRVIHSVLLSLPRPPGLSHPLHKLRSTYRLWVYVSVSFH